MAHPGILHKYSKKLVAFEHASSTTPSSPPHTLLWIGGLGDGLLTVEYPATIAASLPHTWVLAEVVLRSSYNGWATGRLSRDARELGECVAYFRSLRPGSKIVLMGHSTGCQDIMEYLVGPGADSRPGLDGVVLQGGVSDREAWDDMLSTADERSKFAEVVDTAKRMIDAGDEKGIVNVSGNIVAEGLGAQMSAYRTYSLLARGGDDDYFSADLSDEVFRGTFGAIPKSTRVAFLLGELDPYVPKRIDKAALLERWTRIVREGGGVVDSKNGGVVPGAHHNLNGDPEEVVADLVRRVVGFVEGVEKSEEGVAGSRL
ncbi:hypothetical protein FB567DRAFT_434732 [Paraphoma chrysanthemicola]|uniref:DUF1749-domain-containing protein n=1 Tax=Paraphoma chrysanthemicola TaxID=798071 RepID=A0A8K0RFT1_9PLEO|nr:hypothetical protein FB567DRAFT_434732 [Paraphoma chrysanthemicola]